MYELSFARRTHWPEEQVLSGFTHNSAVMSPVMSSASLSELTE